MGRVVPEKQHSVFIQSIADAEAKPLTGGPGGASVPGRLKESGILNTFYHIGSFLPLTQVCLDRQGLQVGRVDRVGLNNA